MHATIGFTSAAGSGSIFWFDLRLPQARASQPPPASRSLPELEQLRGTEGPPIKVVYVEDNPSNVAFMQDFFSEYERVELLTAASAETGLPLIRAVRPDLVFMDLNLPGMSGLDATQQLASWPETHDIPVVALSAAAMMRDSKPVRGAGFYRYLTKPIQLSELTRTLEELFGAAD
jgi:CheY-like chemotaxis protein